MYKTKLNDINLHIPELEPEISHPKVEPLKETTKKGKLVEVAFVTERAYVCPECDNVIRGIDFDLEIGDEIICWKCRTKSRIGKVEVLIDND